MTARNPVGQPVGRSVSQSNIPHIDLFRLQNPKYLCYDKLTSKANISQCNCISLLKNHLFKATQDTGMRANQKAVFKLAIIPLCADDHDIKILGCPAKYVCS